MVRRCYWPLLRLVADEECPLAMEAPGVTLEEIARLDPEWIQTLRSLLQEGRCQWVGSGYSQVIGPLVPAEVTSANLRLGLQVYRDLLEVQPQVALVNEQAYAAGLVPLYRNAGYQAIIMEWDNVARAHPEWNPLWRYYPQRAAGPGKEEIGLLWNHSIAFQKFQRYVHGELEEEAYLDYLARHDDCSGSRFLPLYGNDAEVFDFRPGRYRTEAALHPEGEWKRIERLFRHLKDHPRFQLLLPGQILQGPPHPESGHRLQLEAPEQPIPVKKQPKYNITRWAVTGRADLEINTACFKIYSHLKNQPDVDDSSWKKLCFLWGSDFRTHITERRWKAFRQELEQALSAAGLGEELPEEESWTAPAPAPALLSADPFLTLQSFQSRVRLNLRRGLALDGLWFGEWDGPPLCGTLPHGFYDDIQLGSDWYSGHTVLEALGQPKVTDLSPAAYRLEEGSEGSRVTGRIETGLGPLTKIVFLSHREAALTMEYRFDWSRVPPGSLRLGFVTLHPEAFDKDSLEYRTHNGGYEGESFFLEGHRVNHGEAVSFLVSASQAVGLTEGWIEIGDSRRHLRIEVDQTLSALVGLVTYRECTGGYFCRLAFSARELDDTTVLEAFSPLRLRCRIRIRPAPLP